MRAVAIGSQCLITIVAEVSESQWETVLFQPTVDARFYFFLVLSAAAIYVVNA